MNNPKPAAELARQIEEASLNAWPAMRQILLDGWILRFSKGFTKRSNSIIPLYPSAVSAPHQKAGDRSPPEDIDYTQGLAEKIRYCENLYAREQLQTIFRLTSINDEVGQRLEDFLAKRGYENIETSLVLSCDLSDDPRANSDTRADHTQHRILPLDQWLGVYSQLTGMKEPASSLHRVILNSIAGECCFMGLFVKDTPVACGLGVFERNLVGLFDIFTHPDMRGRGYARATVEHILDWACEHSAKHAYLQVLKANKSAISLYSGIGFRELYHYWYRAAP
ncbi:MAG: GNAT family N-acetyltransferase [Pseudomonadota bacterium]